MSNEYKDWLADNMIEDNTKDEEKDVFSSPVVASYYGPIDSFIRYYIDEEKKTITAVYEDCRFDAMKVVRTKLKNTFSVYESDIPLMNRTYRGKAVCHENDLWDEEVGIKVAREKCLYKYRRDMAKSIGAFLDSLTPRLKKLENFESHLIKKLLEQEEETNSVF